MNLTKALTATITISVICLIIIGIFSSKPNPTDPEERVSYWKKTGQWDMLVGEYKKRLEQSPMSVVYHHEFLNSLSYELDWTEKSKIKEDYEKKSMSTDPDIADIGNFGVGFIYMEMGKYEKALEWFQQVKNEQFPYLNNLMGNAFVALGNPPEAAWYYSREIAVDGNLKPAVSNLSSLLIWQRNLPELQALMDNEKTVQYVPLNTQKRFHFIAGNTMDFLRTFFKVIYSRLQWMGILAAILMALIWLNFVTRFNLFTKGNLESMFFCLLAGMVFSIGFGLGKEVFYQSFPDQLININFFQIWLVNGVTLGFLSELVKLIPLLLLMRFTSIVKEPYDYILYASLTAIGFGLAEALMFPIEYGNNINPMSIRVLISTVTHLFLSATIAYGIVLNTWRYRKIKAVRLLLICLLAMSMAGLYYTLEVRDWNWPLLSFFLALLLLTYWSFYMNNSLNHSKVFDRKEAIEVRAVFRDSMYLLAALILLEFAGYAFTYGISLTVRFTAYLVLAGLAVNVMLYVMGRGVQVISGEWRSLGSMFLDVMIQLENEEMVMPEGLDDVLDQKIMLGAFSTNEFAQEFLPNEGVVVNRYDIKDDFRWYLVQLDEPGYLQGYHSSFVFIKPKEVDEVINTDDDILAGLYLIEEMADPQRINAYGKGLAFVHWARVRIV